MDRWVDTLSEDWVSQPRLSPPTSLTNGSPLMSDNSSTCNASRSRIPRPKPRAISRSMSDVVRPRKTSSQSELSKGDGQVLNERTSSRLNARSPSARKEITKSSNGVPSPAHSHRSSRALSDSSLQSVIHNTVHYRVSGPSQERDHQQHETPQWKRRVLKGEIGYGEQRDLFSPMGLENIFAPGAAQSRPKHKKTRSFNCARDNEVPSSPPPYASAPKPKCQEAVSDGKPDEKGALEALREEDEENETSTSTDHVAYNRTVSGQEDSRNEKFSPVFVSRHNTVDGRVDYAALDVSHQHLKQPTGRLTLQESVRPSTGSSDHDVQYGQSDNREDSASPERRTHDWTSQSLPDDLSTSTEVFASKGGFITVRRGGYSDEGSFRRRPLSPSSNPCFDSSELLALQRSGSQHRRSSLPTASSPALGFARTCRASPSPQAPPTALQTPAVSPSGEGSNVAKLESSGSPLKLFGEYDTFTNNRLLRRMDQFEATSSSIVPQEEDGDSDTVKAKKGAISGTDDEAGTSEGLPEQATRISTFGVGKFHGYEFKEEVSITSYQSNSYHDSEEIQPNLSQMNQSAEMRVILRLERSPEISGRHQSRSRRSTRSSIKSSSKITQDWVAEVASAHIQGSTKCKIVRQERSEELQEVEGRMKSKRLPNSPAKDPAPKRRRTYDNAEGDVTRTDLQSVEERSQQMQTIIGRKRKDARYDANDQEADPKVIALRQMLRPRTPTPNQHRKQAPKTGATEGLVSGPLRLYKPDGLEQQSTILNGDAEDVEAQTQAVAAELATFAVHAAKHIDNDSRKPSITTQDFLNEATKVMNIIRAKGKPPSGLASIEQSQTEDAESNGQNYDEQSTKDEFSRPPSREGGSLRMLRGMKQLDPRVLSHLKKFEEKDDVDDAIASSLKSLDINRHPIQHLGTMTREDVLLSEAEVESEPSNIRILENAQLQRKRKHLSSSLHDDTTEQPPDEIKSHVSQPSSGPSTGRSIPTGSSRSSANKALISPDKVSHLIPAQAAGMTYDHVRQTWVKRKGSEVCIAVAVEKGRREATEDDPFEDIPDLSVDELEELKRIKTIEMQTDDGSVKLIGPYHGVGEESRMNEDVPPAGGNLEDARPRTRESLEDVPFNMSSVASKYSHMESSQPMTETRATSWGDEPAATKIQLEKLQQSAGPQQPDHGTREDEIEHEISILEGRFSKTPTRPDHLKHRARVVTVAFSSPLVDHVQSTGYEDSPDRNSRLWTAACESILENSPFEHSSIVGGHQRDTSKRTSASFARKATYSKTARRISFGGQSFTARPISRIDEQTEASFIQVHDRDRRQNLDVTISTPLAALSPAGRLSKYSFHLSPLPDFTVHQLDESLQLDISHVAKRGAHQSLKEVESSFSLAVSELVKKITDVEPYEPYWEYLRQLHLRGQGLITLHLLRDFCGRIEELDVSNNELGQLNGVPSTIRHLRVQRNCLSNLTAWAHLSNLQYLDVSGNRIESLEGFSSLIHLRELRADDNRINNIEGIFELDGLISLRLRNNCLESVDFESAGLTRLCDLDISGNQLKHIRNMHCLPALVDLKLDHNSLAEFAIDATKPLPALQSLQLANNRLKSFDTSIFPNLRTLQLDGNSINQVANLHKSKHLETLSLREQTLAQSPNPSHVHITDCLDIHHLHLSGNILPTLSPTAPFLNLHHLELASSGLQTLPPNFGTRIPNTRSLNLNFNALKDIRPLLGITRLSKISLAGNRVCRLRRTTAVLARFKHLTDLDLRNNPVTLGFYPPPSSASTAATETRLLAPQSQAGADVTNTDTDTGPDQDVDTASHPSPYALASAHKQTDTHYRDRLDTETQLRRRVYEMLVAAGCKKVRVLDGLGFERGEGRGEVESRDWVWERLVGLGVVKLRGKEESEGDGGGKREREGNGKGKRNGNGS